MLSEDTMPQLVNGKWEKGDVAASEIKGGAFHREPTKFRDWISQGDDDVEQGVSRRYPPEVGRYQLFVAYLCPWASRTLIFRNLKGLKDIVSVSVAEPVIGENGWECSVPQDAGVKIGAVRYHHELYTASEPTYTGKVSVPVLWDRKEGRIVNNESADIIRILNTAFDHITGNTLDLYPKALRPEIDHWNDLIYPNINNGVYRAGFAKTQESYNEAVGRLFETLDDVENHLSNYRYLAGQYLTEADWRLFVTLVRFDAAYYGAFKCNINSLESYPNLSNYLRELYQWPDVRETVNIDHIKVGYYSIKAINPAQIVPAGPKLDFERHHDRARLPGRGIWDRSEE